jgi:demethylmenaquinone methyltransferase / 2-methoxy-6-polyprenyl-1,4-benzoquinol methylase
MIKAESVKPYQNEGSKKEQVAQMFDNVAGTYDALNRFLSLGIDVYWRKKAINLLRAIAPQRILDVATGTADVALETQKQLQPNKIIGIDISAQMLEVGRQKIEKKGVQNIIELQLGDSENIQFEDDSFDAVTLSFGVRNFENVEQGLKEIYRVLKPNGQLVVLEFSRPRAFPLKQLFNFYFKNILPFIGKMTSKDARAYTYLYESVQAFPDREDFCQLMNRAGFEKAQYQAWTAGIVCCYIGKK